MNIIMRLITSICLNCKDWLVVGESSILSEEETRGMRSNKELQSHLGALDALWLLH